MIDEYLDGDVRLIKGDCMELLKDIPSGSVDLVLVDPPYGMIDDLELDKYKENRRNKGEEWDVMINMEELFREYRRILRVNGRLIMFSKGVFTLTVREKRDGVLDFSHSLYWDKDSFGNFLGVNSFPAGYIEDLSVFTKIYPDTWEEDKGLKDYAKNIREYTEMSRGDFHKERGDYRLVHFFTEGVQFTLPTREVYQWLIDEYKIDRMENYLTYEEMEKEKEKTGYKRTYNVDKGNHNPDRLRYKKDKRKSYHPTEKPVDLLSHLIRVYTNEGDLVLDNTMGSGSTGVASIKEGRRFIGMELDDEYYEVSKVRIGEAIRDKNKEEV